MWYYRRDNRVISGSPKRPEFIENIDFTLGDIPDCTNANGGKFIKKRNLLGKKIETEIN